MDKEGNLLNEYNGDDNCIICMSQKRNTVFVHGTDAHQICCYSCAIKVYNNDKKCPTCRKTIDSYAKVY